VYRLSTGTEAQFFRFVNELIVMEVKVDLAILAIHDEWQAKN
jgi:hypothetical protein